MGIKQYGVCNIYWLYLPHETVNYIFLGLQWISGQSLCMMMAHYSKEVIQEKKWQVLPCGQWFLDPWPISAISKILVIRWRSTADCCPIECKTKVYKDIVGWRIIGSSLPLLIVASMLQQCHQTVHHR